MQKLNILVAGSTGYIGIELVKLLVKHRGVKIKYLCGNSSIGKNISSYDPSLKKIKLPKIVKFIFFKEESYEEIFFPIDELPHKYLILTPLCLTRSLTNSIPM